MLQETQPVCECVSGRDQTDAGPGGCGSGSSGSRRPDQVAVCRDGSARVAGHQEEECNTCGVLVCWGTQCHAGVTNTAVSLA